MLYKTDNEKFMARALSLAKKGVGYTSPNPAVGCVIVKNSRIIARDYHRRAGKPHAEILCLHQAGAEARGADLYVTLEPCCIYGRTPPCTEAIIEAGIKRVIAGTPDPNPMVNGGGLRVLKKAGIEATVGILEQKCREINPGYNKYITSGLPLVTVKYAQSLDGRIATRTGSSQWISSPEARKFAHKLRASHDAVIIGANTANRDNPQLTVRQVKGRNPVRIILTKSGEIKKNLRLLQDGEAPTIIITSKGGLDRLKGKLNSGVEILAVPMRSNILDLKSLVEKLGKRGITSILVEGGGEVISGFIRQRLVDRMAVISAPIVIGEGKNAIGDLNIRNIAEAIKLKNVRHRQIGPDIITTGDIA